MSKATFFLIGVEAEKFPAITKRIYAEGHEIGNHTFTHPDISNVSKRYFEVELNLTERLFEGQLGVKPILFRPPYSIDQEPDTADEVRPLELAQQLGYVTVGDKIDPNDWRDNPRRPADEIVADVLKNLPPCAPGNLSCGNVVLLHDGGGDRSETLKALPRIIDGIRQRGYEIVPVSTLLGKTRADVMPPISANERWASWIDGLNFSLFSLISSFIIFVFFVGDVLMSARLVLIGALASYDRFHRRNAIVDPDYRPGVAVLIPAYNEEKVIERTVRSVLESDYPNLRAIVIDDGSKDKTAEVTRAAFRQEIADGRVTVLTKPNSGKADALNYALEYVTEELFVGIDADTIIAPDAISRLVPHFRDSRVAAMAGNAKVGNRVNLWTRWQALEYITSQNFERRALNTLNAVSVVPGAIGAWRTADVRAAGGYHHDTVAEDADLTMALLQAGYRVNYEDRALGLHRSSHHSERPHAPTLPLVIRHHASRVEAQGRAETERRAGMGRPAQRHHLPDPAAAGVALHRHHVRRRCGLLLRQQVLSSRLNQPGRFPAPGGLLCAVHDHRLYRVDDCLRLGAPATRPQTRLPSARPCLVAALCLPPVVLARLVQDAEARSRRRVVRLGQTRAYSDRAPTGHGRTRA